MADLAKASAPSPVKMSTPQYLTGDREGIKAFLDKFDVFLFDCDGVLWSGDHVFPNTVEVLTHLRKLKKQTIFVTNNSTKSRSDYQIKLSKLGIPSTIEEIFNSSYSAAIYISRILKLPATKRKVFILGESGIEGELDSENIPHIGGSDPQYRRDITPADYSQIAARDPHILDPEVGVVLAGLDFHINYLKLALAYHYITGPNQAIFLATNIDSTLPSCGTLFPGAGTISAPLIHMLNQGNNNNIEPLALGKPSPAMMDAIEGKFRFDRSRACMVGDRLNTDIRFGIDGRLGGTLAVLTGVMSRGDIDALEEKAEGDGADVVRPMAFVDALADLLGGL